LPAILPAATVATHQILAGCLLRGPRSLMGKLVYMVGETLTTLILLTNTYKLRAKNGKSTFFDHTSDIVPAKIFL
jgi:hypothetical protein